MPPYPTAPFYGLPPGTDIRGMGLESFDGRGRVAKSAKTTRPPTIPPELWTKTSPSEKKDAIEVYLAQLAADKLEYAEIAAPASTTSTAPAGKIMTNWQASLLTEDDIPMLPREFASLEPHREHNAWHPPGCIARKLSKKEMDACPRARKALDAEWEKLRTLKRPHPVKGHGAWDEANVREASTVREAARASGQTIHFGRIVELCHEKGSELAPDDPERKMKGRSVLLGDHIKDQDFSWAEFCELGSSPPSMDAAKALDAFGSFPGYTVKTGDAKGAYTQALLLGAETWVTLPENRWPAHWKGKFHRPVVRLVLALYGHADAGGFWEAHCEEKLLSIGWTRLAEEWPGAYWHKKTGSMMIVYVDDFKLAAKHAEHDALWAAIRKVIDMDPETLDGRFLGCSHERFTTSVRSVSSLLDQHPGYHPRQKQGGASTAPAGTPPPAVPPVARIYDPKRTVSVVSYNMERFAVDCVNVFCELSGWDRDKIGTAPTPFLEEANDPVAIFEDDAVKKKGKGKSTEPSGTAASACTGVLSKIACKVLMKIMYIARFARTDLLRAVGVLSTKITKWDTLCDRKLFRIIKYINGTTTWRQIGFVGDNPSELSLGLFSDADFAGDKELQRSTSGVFLALYGPTFLLPAQCAVEEADRYFSQYGRGRDYRSRPRHPYGWSACLASLGDDPRSFDLPRCLPRQSSHGPHHVIGSCAYSTAHQADTPGVRCLAT